MLTPIRIYSLSVQPNLEYAVVLLNTAKLHSSYFFPVK